MKRSVIFSALALLALAVCWLLAYFCVGNGYILPSPWETAAAAGMLLAEGEFYLAFANTLLRTLAAFAASFFLALLFALAAELLPALRSFLAPVISVLRTLPTMAVILALLIWTSPSAAPVIVTALVLFPAMYASALAAFDEAQDAFGRLTRAYRVTVTNRVFRMYLPLAAPSFFKQAGGMLSMGLKITVSAEVLAKTFESLGGLMQDAQIFVEMPRLLALTVLSVAAGFLLEGVCALVARAVTGWKHAA